MKITFLGQLGQIESDSRVMTLARLLANKGHAITIFGTKPYLQNSMNNNGIQLAYRPSFNPEKPGGWLYLVSCLMNTIRKQPEVLHVWGWQAAALVAACRGLFGRSILVWTIDHEPRSYRLAQKLSHRISHSFDKVTTPSRTLQYFIRNSFGLEAAYIPDGYFMPSLPDAPLKPFKLRRNQYIAVIVSDKKQLKFVEACLSKISHKKKIVVLSLKDMAANSANIELIDVKPGRIWQSVLNGAAYIVAADYKTPINMLLSAMNAGKAIMTVNNYYYQEYLGLSAKYFKLGDTAGFNKIAREMAKKSTKLSLGGEAQKRAFNHFRWDRILPEYLAIYHSRQAARVALDSAKKQLLPKMAGSR